MEGFVIKGCWAAVVVFSFVFAACDVPDGSQGGGGGGDYRYTDVVYSPDGKTITLYLDGIGVQQSREQRALNGDLAKMSHDYFEAVFMYRPASGDAVVARSAWEFGRGAGVSGIYRTAEGVDYAGFSEPAAGGAAAIIFVGMKSDKTLLAAGKLLDIDGVTDTDVAGGTQLQITTATRYVTFVVDAFYSNIAQFDGSGLENTNHFLTAAGHATDKGDPNNVDYLVTTFKTLQLGNPKVTYPVFTLPGPDDPGAIAAKYFIISNSKPGMIASHDIMDGGGIIQYDEAVFYKRTPQYVGGGRTYRLKNTIDVATGFAVTPPYVSNPIGSPFTPRALGDADRIIPMEFTVGTGSGGVFSALFSIPVLAMTSLPSTNGAANHERWRLKPGIGAELYNIDGGRGPEGAVLIAVGDVPLDWIEITTTPPAMSVLWGIGN